jgi:prevent-host-death family protein
MTTVVNVYEAKTQLSRLLEQVERGEEVIVARSGRPVARLLPYVANDQPRRLGMYADKIVIGAGFDEYDEQITVMFEDGDPASGSAA